MNDLEAYAVYLLACRHPFGVVKTRLQRRFGVALANKQITALAAKHAEEINKLSDDLPEQLRLAQQYGDLHLVNPIQRLLLLQEAALDIAKGEERLSKEGKTTRLKNSNSAVAIERLTRSIRDEVEQIVGNKKEEIESFRLIVDLADPKAE